MTGKTAQFVPLQQVHVEDPFFSPIQDTVIRVMIPYQERVMRDEVHDVRKSHVIENFRIAAGESSGEYYGRVFQDSDLAKWLEAVSYALTIRPDPALEARADDLIRLVEKAQQPDGYLDTFFTVAEPEHRWQNLQECHELYCGGHMTEAGVAYYQATGKDTLLKVAERFCDHVDARFGPGKETGLPGHEEIELSLLRLYKQTGETRYRDLAAYFVNERGKDPAFFSREAAKRGWKRSAFYDEIGPEYMQNHKPLREQDKVVGHAVRCMYLLTAAADLAGLTGDDGLMEACRRLWRNMTGRRMYVTGGIGSTSFGEAFTADFDLPNDTAYAETCASVGVCFFAKQMLEAEPSAEYADILERELYNGTISGMQLDGTKFFYINQLEANPEMSGEVYGQEEYTPERIGWYDCACCPPNLARLMTSLGSYIWSSNDNTVYSHLFIGSHCRTETAGGVSIRLSGHYPWSGTLRYEIETKAEKAEFTLALRNPGWCRNRKIRVNGQLVTDCTEEKGYFLLHRVWQTGDLVEYDLEMKPRRVYADPRVRADAGCTALMRGPVVYAFEEVDNGGILQSCRIPRDAVIQEKPFDPDLLGGIVALQVEGKRQKTDGGLYSETLPQEEPAEFTAVPYYAWSNRGKNQMRVWMRE